MFGINKNVENVFARKLTTETHRILKMRINVKYEILEMINIDVESSAFVLEEIKAVYIAYNLVNELDR